MAKTTAYNYYTMMQYGAKMHAIIATIEIGQTGQNVAHLAAKFTDVTL